MNCSPTICIALLLLSLSAGMFLLYKTQKESLGTFFKVVAWFVIVVSFCSMVCCGLRCMMHGCMKGNKCEEKEKCEMGMGGGDCRMGGGECRMGHGNFEKRIIICTEGGEDCEMRKGCSMEGKEKCEGEEGEGECKEGMMEGCKKGKEQCEMKMGMKKDTVVKKK
jgi:hypothetical protein